MNIGTIDRLSLENLAPGKIQEARTGTLHLPGKSAEMAGPEGLDPDGIGLNIEDLDKVHSLNADRVASLIADPFGDE